jgi:hypothetical protein
MFDRKNSNRKKQRFSLLKGSDQGAFLKIHQNVVLLDFREKTHSLLVKRSCP